MALLSRRWAGVLILVLWAVSLALPVFSTCRAGYDHVGGWFLLLFGWMGLMVMMPAWLANVFIVVTGVMLFFRSRARLWLTVPAGVLALTALGWTEWTDDSGAVPICHFHAGYWLWLAVAAIVTVIPFFVRPMPDTTQP